MDLNDFIEHFAEQFEKLKRLCLLLRLYLKSWTSGHH